MCSNNLTKCQNVLKTYFNNIIMLDDDFRFVSAEPLENTKTEDGSFDTTAFEDVDPAAMEDIPDTIGEGIKIKDVKEPKKDSIISNMLYYCRENNINLFPYEYIDATDFDVLKFIRFSKQFSWIILDWNIPNYTEVYKEVLNSLGKDKKLRFVTVYTDSDDLNPITETVFEISKELSLKIENIAEEKHLYQIGSIIIFFQQKKDCNICKLLDLFSLEMLDNFGELFLAVLQYAQVIEERSSEVLKNTANPFRILTLLQIMKNDTSAEGFNKELNKVISDNILAFATLPMETTEYIKENVINFIKQYTKKQTLIKDCCDCYVGKEDKKPGFIKLCDDNKLYNNLKEENINALFKYFNDMRFSGVESKRLSDQDLLGDITGLGKKEYPTILDCIIIGSLKPNLPHINIKKHYSEALLKLLEFIKFDKYEDFTTFETRLNIGGIEVNNLFSLGDIFERKGRNPAFYDYLLCVTPECDAARLNSSTDEKVIFVPGREISWDKFKNFANNGNDNGGGNGNLKKYASILPCCKKEGEYIVPVEWEFYSVHAYDLKLQEDKNKLKEYQRYYKMRYEYAKQIQAKFIGYFLRNGVDELFLKDKNVSFGNMLIDMIM